MNVAVLVRGHSFRQGSQNAYGTCSDTAPQGVASKSHYRALIDPLRSMGIRVRVFCRTYASAHSDALRTMYPDAEIVVVPPGPTQGEMLIGAWEMIPADTFDHVIVLRFDLVFKVQVAHAWARCMTDNPNAVVMPFRMRLCRQTVHEYHFETHPDHVMSCDHIDMRTLRCVDTLYSVPRALFGYMTARTIGMRTNHAFLLRLQLAIGTPVEVAYLCDEESDTDPEKMRNCVYRFCSRGEA